MRRLSALLAPGVAFSLAAALRWEPHSIVGTDGAAYVTAGVNLVRDGEFVNLFEETELWFPPLYPLLIGFTSLGGHFDPVASARLVSLVSGLAGVLLTVAITYRASGGSVIASVAAGMILALNRTYQLSAVAPLSEAMATALVVGALALWLRVPHLGGWRGLTVGILVGAAYLTRPEAILLLPCWFAIDAWAQGPAAALRRFAVPALAALLVLTPYTLWLSHHEGRLLISGKTAVNLASGRATYSGKPREEIDPENLEIRFTRHDVTLGGEIGRYLFNWKRIADGYLHAFPPRSSAVTLALAVVGAAILWRARNRRAVFGLASLFVFLFVMAAFEIKARYLLLTLPAISLCFGFGLSAVLRALRRPDLRPSIRWGLVSVLVWCIGGTLMEGIVRPAMAFASKAQPRISILRDAAVMLRAAEPRAPVYETWSIVAFYSGQPTRRLTADDLDTILRYMRRREAPGQWAWLVVSTLDVDRYHPTVRALLQSTPVGIDPMVELSDERGAVTIFRVDLGRASPRDGSGAERPDSSRDSLGGLVMSAGLVGDRPVDSTNSPALAAGT